MIQSESTFAQQTFIHPQSRQVLCHVMENLRLIILSRI